MLHCWRDFRLVSNSIVLSEIVTKQWSASILVSVCYLESQMTQNFAQHDSQSAPYQDDNNSRCQAWRCEHKPYMLALVKYLPAHSQVQRDCPWRTRIVPLMCVVISMLWKTLKYVWGTNGFSWIQGFESLEDFLDAYKNFSFDEKSEVRLTAWNLQARVTSKLLCRV